MGRSGECKFDEEKKQKSADGHCRRGGNSGAARALCTLHSSVRLSLLCVANRRIACAARTHVANNRPDIVGLPTLSSLSLLRQIHRSTIRRDYERFCSMSPPRRALRSASNRLYCHFFSVLRVVEGGRGGEREYRTPKCFN